jgi:hypothetical protein
MIAVGRRLATFKLLDKQKRNHPQGGRLKRRLVSCKVRERTRPQIAQRRCSAGADVAISRDPTAFYGCSAPLSRPIAHILRHRNIRSSEPAGSNEMLEPTLNSDKLNCRKPEIGHQRRAPA